LNPWKIANRLWSVVPKGGSLPEEVWLGRHRFLVGLTWFHAVIIALVGPVFGYGWELSFGALFRGDTVLHTVAEGLVVAACALMASRKEASRTLRASLVGLGLVSSSAILVHLSGGYIELHFHFFVMLVFLALYQDWVPYGLAVLYVAVHHGVVGVLWPREVYNHAAAISAPWTWAGIHAFFVLWSCVGSIIAWRFNEAAIAQNKLILDSAGEGIYGLDLDGKTTFVNPAAAKMLGYEIGELIGRGMHDLLHHTRADGTSYPREECPIYAAFKDGIVRRVSEEVFWSKDGTSFPVDYVSTPIIKGGELCGAVVTFNDITERKRAAKETQRSLEQVRALREIDRAITSTLDLRTVLAVLLEKIDLTVPYAAATVRLFSEESGLLEPVASRNLDEKEWKAESWKAGRGIPNVVFDTGAPVRISNVQKDPRVRDLEFFERHGLVSYLGVPLIVQDEILGVLGFYTKEEHEFISEEIEFLTTLAGQAAIAIHNSQLYEETARLAAELAKSNKVKDEFLSVMSHELRTPLNIVMGYTAMIKDEMLGTVNLEQRKALEKVILRSSELLNMITGILYVTSIEAKEVRIQNSQFALPDLLDELSKSYKIFLTKPITLKWNYPSDLPALTSDRDKLRFVLQKIIDNATKFTETGGVTISARMTGIGDQGLGIGAAPQSPNSNSQSLNPNSSFLEVKVADTGVGIAKEKLPIIFEKFRQADSTETRLHGGVGLGLFIAKHFVELMGGKIEVDTEEGKGSIFTVQVPCLLSYPEAANQRSAAQEAPAHVGEIH
jgi:two-component system sensor histidine kinase/response regulator